MRLRRRGRLGRGGIGGGSRALSAPLRRAGRRVFQMTHVVIPAAGRGERMGGKTKKQFLTLCDLPIIVHTLSAFQASSVIDEITCVVSKEDQSHLERLLSEHGLTKVKRILHGGERRQDSVRAAIDLLGKRFPSDEMVLVHDAVRPLVTSDLIERVLEGARKFGGAVAGLPMADSLKQVSGERFIERSVPREGIWLMQTPQAFSLGTLAAAFLQAAKERFFGTDEAMLVERIGIPIHCVEGSVENIKITTPSDLRLAESLLSGRRRVSERIERPGS